MGSPWHGLAEALRLLQSGDALSQDLAHAMAASIHCSSGHILVPRQKAEVRHCSEGLAEALGLLRAADESSLTDHLLRVALSLLGLRAGMMPWVLEATEQLARGGHLSEARLIPCTRACAAALAKTFLSKALVFYLQTAAEGFTRPTSLRGVNFARHSNSEPTALLRGLSVPFSHTRLCRIQFDIRPPCDINISYRSPL